MTNDPGKRRVMAALRKLRRDYPDARSLEVVLRDDGSLIRRVNDGLVAASPGDSRIATFIRIPEVI